MATKIAKANRTKNPLVGCKGGDHLIPVSFRNHDLEFVVQVQRLYAEGYYTQEQLYEELVRAGYEKLSLSIISKMCRCDPHNIEKVDLTALRKVKVRGLKL